MVLTFPNDIYPPKKVKNSEVKLWLGLNMEENIDLCSTGSMQHGLTTVEKVTECISGLKILQGHT